MGLPAFFFAAASVPFETQMLSNLFQLITRRPPASLDQVFVKDVHITRSRPRSRKLERLILLGWVLIGVKSGLIIWAVHKYHVPIDPLWVIGPTVLFALLCTAVYFRGE
jgi:hypothetical protein